jgi:helicase SWR1
MSKTPLDFHEWLQQDNALEGEDALISVEKLRREALMRLRITQAAEPGGILSQDRCSKFQSSPYPEPRKRFGNWDHVAAHTVLFSKLLRAEHTEHVRKAKMLATAVVSEIHTNPKWSKLREAKSIEDVWKEEYGYQVKRYRQLAKDVELKWLMVRQEVDRIKLVKWEHEQEILGNKALDQMLDQSTMLLQQERYRESTDLLTDGTTSRAESVTEFDGSVTQAERDSSASGTASEDDFNMSESDDNASEAEEVNNDDANLTQEQLLQKYAHVLDKDVSASEDSEDEASEEESEEDEDEEGGLAALLGNVPDELDSPTTTEPDATAGGDDADSVAEDGLLNGITEEEKAVYDKIKVEDLDPNLLDDSDDESTDMSDDMGTSEDGDADESGEGSEESDNDGGS